MKNFFLGLLVGLMIAGATMTFAQSNSDVTPEWMQSQGYFGGNPAQDQLDQLYQPQFLQERALDGFSRQPC